MIKRDEYKMKKVITCNMFKRIVHYNWLMIMKVNIRMTHHHTPQHGSLLHKGAPVLAGGGGFHC